ncbi:MAG: LysR family transcriptional regulator [Aliidongia sp.]
MRAPHHLNALGAFEAAARHLSYVAAADELNVTPAAVGQLVRGLEETLGVELFHRSQAGPSRLVLTEAARAAVPDLQAGFDRLAAAVRTVEGGAIACLGHRDGSSSLRRQMAAGPRGPLRRPLSGV